MHELSPLDADIFYSSNVAPKFSKKLDILTLVSLQDVGLNEMIKDGVAYVLKILHDPYAIVIFPKISPSRPEEIMITILPTEEGVPPRSSLSDFSQEDALTILQSSKKIMFELKKQAIEHNVAVEDAYIFQHFNPKDLTPKTMFNGSVAHLHFHIQLYGHSIKEFPRTFAATAAKLRDYEGANRLLRDSGVTLFTDLMRKSFPQLKIEMKNAGCVGIGEVDEVSELDGTEINQIQIILKTWGDFWSEIEKCFGTRASGDGADFRLFSPEERKENIFHFSEKYQLSGKNQKLLLFLAEKMKDEDSNTWRNFYHGPNGAFGIHFNNKAKKREWLFAPRVFRSWSRHLPIILTQNSRTTEWTTKNEAGDGLVNKLAQEEMFGIQRKVIEGLKN